MIPDPTQAAELNIDADQTATCAISSSAAANALADAIVVETAARIAHWNAVRKGLDQQRQARHAARGGEL